MWKGETMREIIVGRDDNDQRVDRFLKKYLDKANSGFIYKMIRKKNIVLNGAKIKPEDMVYEGDVIKLFLSEETIEKFMSDREHKVVETNLDIIYEDEHIIVINKPVGMLSHSIKAMGFEENVVDSMVSYLIERGEYVPRIQKTFTPSISNRLDRNTSGIIIGAKSYEALKGINASMRERKISKYYLTIVGGKVSGHFTSTAQLNKNENRNRVQINSNAEDEKEIITVVNSLKANNSYSYLEIELITGRTHQIRAHLAHLGNPVIGDRKYGNPRTNDTLRRKYGLRDQLLHSNRMVLDGLEGDLEYLNGKEFIADLPEQFMKIKKELIDGKN